MKVIVIDDKDARALVDRLALTKFTDRSVRCAQDQGVSGELAQDMIDEIHRRFHYVVVCWLQEQGASV